MERCTSVPTGAGEQSLTPGEQRILALLEQGQQRMEQRLERMDQRLERMDQRLERVEQRVEQMDQRLERVEQRVEQMDQRLERVEQRVEQMDQRMERVEQRLEQMDQRLERVEQRVERLEHRSDRLEQRVESLGDSLGERLRDLTVKVDHEAAASKMRDRDLFVELQRIREADQVREVRTLQAVYKELNALRMDVSERLSQHNTRLEMLEQIVQQNCEALRNNSTALQGLKEELRQLTARLEGSLPWRSAAGQPGH